MRSRRPSFQPLACLIRRAMTTWMDRLSPRPVNDDIRGLMETALYFPVRTSDTPIFQRVGDGVLSRHRAWVRRSVYRLFCDDPDTLLVGRLPSNAAVITPNLRLSSRRIDEALARWRHKGVEAIPYAQTDDIVPLGDVGTLGKESRQSRFMATRALDLAMAGPEKLQPHQRDNSRTLFDLEGVQGFAERTPQPSGSAFSIRYADTPARNVGLERS